MVQFYKILHLNWHFLLLKVNFNIYCKKIADQVLRKYQQPYIPKPIGIWQLSKSSLTEEPTTDMLIIKNNIGIDPLWTPSGFLGSPLLSPLLPQLNPINSHLIVDYKIATPSWRGITVMFWLRLDSEVVSTGPYLILVIPYSLKLDRPELVFEFLYKLTFLY